MCSDAGRQLVGQHHVLGNAEKTGRKGLNFHRLRNAANTTGRCNPLNGNMKKVEGGGVRLTSLGATNDSYGGFYRGGLLGFVTSRR